MVDFVVGGAPKAGSTTLYNLLKGHDEIGVSKIKDYNFFHSDKLYIKGMNHYYKTLKKGRKITGEVSSAYIFSEMAPERIRRNLGETKLIFILRDPIDRAFSQYLHDIRNGEKKNLDFVNYIKRQVNFGKKPLQGNWSEKHYMISCYYTNIKRYQEMFGKENVHVLMYEDLLDNKEGTLAALSEFLEVSPDLWPNLPHSNPAAVPKFQTIHNALMGKNFIKESIKVFIPVTIGRPVKLWLSKINLRPMEKKNCLGEKDYAQLAPLFREEIRGLEDDFGLDITKWKTKKFL